MLHMQNQTLMRNGLLTCAIKLSEENCKHRASDVNKIQFVKKFFFLQDNDKNYANNKWKIANL